MASNDADMTSDQEQNNDEALNTENYDSLEPPSKAPRLDLDASLCSGNSSHVNDYEEGNDVEDTDLKEGNLHEFEIIDEVDNEGENVDNEESDEYLDDNELYDLLDQGLDMKLSADGEKQIPESLEEKEKIVLQEKGTNPFDILPEGWVVVTHNSGMPVYLHKDTRVCTMSRPYFLGPGSVRRHDIPVSAIPCLQYRRALQKETDEKSGTIAPVSEVLDNSEEPNVSQEVENSEKMAEFLEGSEAMSAKINGENSEIPESSMETDDQSSKNPVCQNQLNGTVKTEGDLEASETEKEKTVNVNKETQGEYEETTAGESGKVLPRSKVRIETLSERKQDTSLDSFEVRQYCEKLFQFTSITVKKWKTWKDRRVHMKKRFRPELPSNTKLLITCPVPPTSKTGMIKSNKLKEFVLNPSGKSYICILHEYIQHTMRVQPRYKYKELENSLTPFSATVLIEDIEYGTGYASSKKAAKLQAAKTTLEVLIPDMNKVTQETTPDIEDLSFFDEVKIEDPRVYELGNKAGQPSPYQILDECLKRNYGLGDTKCTMNMKLLKHQKSEFTLTVGKHTASVIAKNKRDGKQRAAQAILQLLHPHVQCWGSLLRLYGKSSVKGLIEKREELNINQLQNQDKSVQPCLSILEKLKSEMMKLHSEKGSIKSKGKLHIETTDLPKKVPNLDL